MKIAVVTGASSGIGEATARELARRGWKLVLVARRRERLEPLAAELGGEYEVCDVSDRADVDRAVASILERHPRVDLLVNNAGIPGRGDFFSLEPERIEAVLRTNYLGCVWMVRALEAGLQQGSHVVNVVSVAGTVAFAPAGPYAASKHAQLAFSRSLTGLLAARGVRVHTVLPGFVETEGFPQKSVLRSAFFRRTVIGPELVAERIAGAVESGKRELFVPRWYRVFSLDAGAAAGPVRARGRPLRLQAAELARLREALHGGEQLVRLRARLGLVTGRDRAGDAVVDVVVEHLQADVLERGHRRPDLGEDVDAVALLLDHLLDPAHLPLDPTQSLADRVLVVAMFGHVRTLLKARSRSEFETTKTLEKAIAAAATIGFRYPATASGIAATL